MRFYAVGPVNFLAYFFYLIQLWNWKFFLLNRWKNWIREQFLWILLNAHKKKCAFFKMTLINVKKSHQIDKKSFACSRLVFSAWLRSRWVTCLYYRMIVYAHRKFMPVYLAKWLTRVALKAEGRGFESHGVFASFSPNECLCERKYFLARASQAHCFNGSLYHSLYWDWRIYNIKMR